MRGSSFVAALLGSGVLLAAAPALGMRNPARVYCTALGYDYIRGRTPEGVIGVCKLPGDRYVDAWRFYLGEVALDFSYCAQQGLEPRRVDDPTICRGCTACVMPDGAVLPVAAAMGLRVAESVCGDGRCGTMESFGNCPQDCTSGLYDDFCDGQADGICDRDCAADADPDCTAAPTDGGVGPGPTPQPPEGSGCGCGAASPGAVLGWALLFGLALVSRRRR